MYMKKINKNPILIVLVVSFVLATLSLTGPTVAFAATTPSLGAAATYGVLASTYTNTAAGTTINGDIGFTTGPAVVPGGVHINYGSGAPYATAGADQGTALAALAAEACTFTFGGGPIDLATDITHGPVGVYNPGVYCNAGAMDVGGPLTLSGNGTYIFRTGGALTSTAGAIVTLAGGASACDVFWTPTAATTLAANTTFAGTVISDAGITIGANTIWEGQALAFGGTVTTDTDTLTVPICAAAPATLHVVKAVINDNGGTAVAADFNLRVKLLGVDVVGSPAIGTVAPGTSYTLDADTYVVSEDALAGYSATFSGDCDASGNITLAPGDDKTCTITNDDVAATATINVVKTVINDNGRTKVVADFPLFVNGVPVVSGVTNTYPAPATYTVTETVDPNYTQIFSLDCAAGGSVSVVPGDVKFCVITNNDRSSGGGGGGSHYVAPVPPLIDVVKVPDPLALPDGAGPVKYTYTLHNVGTVPVTDITMVGDSCSPITLVSGDINVDAKLDVDETWIYSCSKTLSETHTNTVTATGWANGISATDIASATVVVGMPVVPPLIHLTKVPNPLTLPVGGGMVTYTEKITNPGTVALSNITLVDNKCSPMKYISGDTNNDSKLDPTETWKYTCRQNLTESTTNIATARGEANGISVRDVALATVVVATAVPALPNTGFAPANILSWALVAAGIVVLGVLAYVMRKKRKI